LSSAIGLGVWTVPLRNQSMLPQNTPLGHKLRIKLQKKNLAQNLNNICFFSMSHMTKVGKLALLETKSSRD
jgi:hypothetical protein